MDPVLISPGRYIFPAHVVEITFVSESEAWVQLVNTNAVTVPIEKAFELLGEVGKYLKQTDSQKDFVAKKDSLDLITDIIVPVL